MRAPTYYLPPEGGIICLRCGCTSHNATDRAERFCAFCRRWHAGAAPARALSVGQRVAGGLVLGVTRRGHLSLLRTGGDQMFEDDTEPPQPGAPAAVALGCTCDPEANRRGEGIPFAGGSGRGFWVRAACPLHGAPPPAEPIGSVWLFDNGMVATFDAADQDIPTHQGWIGAVYELIERDKGAATEFHGAWPALPAADPSAWVRDHGLRWGSGLLFPPRWPAR